MLKTNIKLLVLLTFILLGSGCFGEFINGNLFNNSSAWHSSNFKTSTKIDFLTETYENSKIAVLGSPDISGNASLWQLIKAKMAQGDIVKLSVCYKTQDFSAGENPSFYIQASYNSGTPTGKMWQKISLTPVTEWTKVEKTVTLKNDISDVLLTFAVLNFKGKVFLAKPSLEVIKQESKINPEEIYVWEDAEDIDERAVLSSWKPKEEENNKNFFSGRGGALYKEGKSFKWTFDIKKVADMNILEARKRAYFIWYRIYGFKEPGKFNTILDKANIFSFDLKSTENVDSNNKYSGGGNFYWQAGGSFVSNGGRHTIELTGKGKTYLDAVIITTDESYKPELFEASAVSRNDFIKNLRGDHVFTQQYSEIGINDKLISLVTLKGSSASPKPVAITTGLPAILHITMPEEVLLENVHSHWASAKWSGEKYNGHLLTYKKVSTKNINGKQVSEYEAYFYYLGPWDMVFLSVRANPKTYKQGQTLEATCYLEYSGAKQTPEAIVFRTLDIKPAVAFKEIFIGPVGRTPDFYFEIPGIFEMFKYAGFNAISMFHFLQVKDSSKLYNISRDFLKEAKQNNIIILNNHSPFYGIYEMNERAISIDGQKGVASSLAFNENGEPMKKNIETIKNNAQYGVSGMFFDDEEYNYGGDKYDFNPEIFPLFEKYLKDNHSTLSYKNPIEIVKHKENNPELYNAWVDFKCYRNGLKYKYFREEYDKYFDGKSTFGKKYLIPVITTKGTIKELRETCYWDLPDLEKYCTHISHMIYTFDDPIKNANIVGDRMAMFNSVLSKPVLAPTLLAGDHIGYHKTESIKGVKYQLIEALMNKAKGVSYWDASAFFNLLVYREISEGIRILSPYEEILLHGDTYKDAAGSNGWERIIGLKLDKKILLYIANYHNPEHLKSVMTIKDQVTKVTDLGDGKVIPVTNNQFSFDYIEDRGKIFLIELK